LDAALVAAATLSVPWISLDGWLFMVIINQYDDGL
jgi:hypothetical protein